MKFLVLKMSTFVPEYIINFLVCVYTHACIHRIWQNDGVYLVYIEIRKQLCEVGFPLLPLCEFLVSL